jgi:hypothetical protein
MASSTPQIFQNITPEQYESFVAKAKAAGIAITGDSGTASKMGVTVSWSYDPPRQQLTVQVISTPFFIKASTVDAKIAALVKENL